MPSINAFPIQSKLADKTDVGLANVDNTSDANKPVSTAAATALALKADASALASGLAAKADVSALAAKADAAATTTALAAKADAAATTTALAAKADAAATTTALAGKASTAVVTSVAPGLAPQLSGNPNAFLNGNGAYVVPPGSVTEFSGLTDATTADLPATNLPLATALAAKATDLAPVTLTGATTLTLAAHGNRALRFNGASATLLIDADATGGWATGNGDASIEISTLAGSAGVPTLATPDGKSITGSATKLIGAVRKGPDSWTVGTTDPAAGGGGSNTLVIVDGIDGGTPTTVYTQPNFDGGTP